MSASTGDWWHNAVEAVADAIDPSGERTNRYWLARRVLDAMLPLFVAEATRRIAELQMNPRSGYGHGWNAAVNSASAVVRGLAGEVGQHD